MRREILLQKLLPVVRFDFFFFFFKPETQAPACITTEPSVCVKDTLSKSYKYFTMF